MEDWRADNECGIEKAGCTYAVNRSSCRMLEYVFEDDTCTGIRMITGQMSRGYLISISGRVTMGGRMRGPRLWR